MVKQLNNKFNIYYKGLIATIIAKIIYYNLIKSIKLKSLLIFINALFAHILLLTCLNNTFSTKYHPVAASLFFYYIYYQFLLALASFYSLSYFLLNFTSFPLVPIPYPIFYRISLAFHQFPSLISLSTRPYGCSTRFNFLLYSLPDSIDPLSVSTSHIIFCQILLVL